MDKQHNNDNGQRRRSTRKNTRTKLRLGTADKQAASNNTTSPAASKSKHQPCTHSLGHVGPVQVARERQNGGRLASAWRAVEQQVRQRTCLDGAAQCGNYLLLLGHVVYRFRSILLDPGDGAAVRAASHGRDCDSTAATGGRRPLVKDDDRSTRGR
jgi:hypothetical protein